MAPTSRTSKEKSDVFTSLGKEGQIGNSDETAVPSQRLAQWCVPRKDRNRQSDNGQKNVDDRKCHNRKVRVESEE